MKKFMFSTIILILTIFIGVILACSANTPVVPTSIILVIADGAGVGHHTLSYYMNDRYSPAAFEHVGLMTTHPGEEGKVTDSAASGTAISTGVKTYNGAIGVDMNKRPVKTVLEYARDQGMATGLVATSTITHATPAAFGAHIDSRSKEDSIALQFTEAGITVLFGGGRKYFASRSEGGVQEESLLESMAADGVQIIESLDEPIDPDRPVVGLFGSEALLPATQGRQPTTTDMALRAVDILDGDPDGFFLMVEESQVDWAGHANNAEYVQAEMASLNDLIDGLLEYQASHPQVLVVLIADHETGGLAVRGKIQDAGYETGWTTGSHTGNMVPIFASGPGGDRFDAVVHNTFIGQTLIEFVTPR